MRHRTLRRVALVLSAGLALAALGLALLLRWPGPPPAAVAAGQGAAAFGQHCARCHEPAEVAPAFSDAASAATAIRLLESHGRAPLEQDLQIAAWLAARGD